MVIKINNQKQNKVMKDVFAELKSIKNQLAKLLFFIPEESLKGYKNTNQIKKDYLESLNNFPPRISFINNQLKNNYLQNKEFS